MPPILIVEDDKKTASLVALYLEREGFETIIAYDGQQALELARHHSPGFVILDLFSSCSEGHHECIGDYLYLYLYLCMYVFRSALMLLCSSQGYTGKMRDTRITTLMKEHSISGWEPL